MSESKTIRVGIVGAGFWTEAMYLPAIAKHPHAETVAVCGRNAERTQAFATAQGIPHHFIDFHEMYNSGLIDAVIISTGNDTHYPMTMAALDAGLHVLCEKPLAMTVQQAHEMTQKAEATGLKCMVPFTYRFMPAERYIKQLIDDGYIGRPYLLNMRYYTGYARGNDYQWRFDLEKSGGGVIGDIASHFFYLAYWYYGEVESVIAQFGYLVERGPRPDGDNTYERAEDTSSILMQFKNGAQGVIVASAALTEETPFGQTHHKEFHGSDGTLYTVNDWDTVQAVSGAKAGEGMLQPLPIPEEIWGNVRRDTVHNTYRDVFRENDYMARGWINDILNDTVSSPSFADGTYIQRMIVACQLSATEGRRVSMDEV
ncbi:MAG: Gfo/Idh/MocA family oxidoreductase [Chloroflexota bacterium]